MTPEATSGIQERVLELDDLIVPRTGPSRLDRLLYYLPNDIIHSIVAFLPLKEILALRQTHRRLKMAVDAANLWRNLLRKSLPHIKKLPPHQSSWYRMYATTRAPFLVIGSDKLYLADVRTYLLRAGLRHVDVVDSSNQLLPNLNVYAAIFIFSFKGSIRDPKELGDRLADYVDKGGGVVSGLFTFGHYPNGFSGGRWFEEKYSPLAITHQSRVTHREHPKADFQEDHFLFQGISKFNGGTMFFYQQLQVEEGAKLLSRWKDGDHPLLATYESKFGGKTTSINFWPVSSVANPNLWSRGGDILILNALLDVASK